MQWVRLLARVVRFITDVDLAALRLEETEPAVRDQGEREIGMRERNADWRLWYRFAFGEFPVTQLETAFHEQHSHWLSQFSISDECKDHQRARRDLSEEASGASRFSSPTFVSLVGIRSNQGRAWTLSAGEALRWGYW